MRVSPWRIGAITAAGVAAIILLDRSLSEGEIFGPAAPSVASDCDIPVAFHLGTVDSRFGLDPPTIRRALRDAVAMWEAAAEDPLFLETEDAGMAVSLVYDERQATAQDRARDREELARTEQELQTRQRRLQREHEGLAEALAAFDQRQRDYNERRRALEEATARWNAGRMERTPANRSELERQRDALQAEREQLRERGRALERRQSDLHDRQDELRRDAAAFNERVSDYNRAGSDKAGFEMARYQRTGNSRSIRVFNAMGADELRVVLAHELGHALGIGHIEDPGAIMYSELHSANMARTTLAAADRKALADACDVTVEGD